MDLTTCCAGQLCRYKTMRENVVSMKAVFVDGAVVETRRKVKKSSSG